MKRLIPLLLLLSAAARAQDCSLQLSGTVSDIDTKSPLPKATVQLKDRGRSTLTDENGFYLFKDLCPGVYVVVVTHVDCLPVESRVRLATGTVRNFVLPHDYNQLREVVVQGYADRQPQAVRESLSLKELREARGQSLGETLKRVSGVSVLQTGSTIFKPVVHGLHGQRLLMLNNGVRHEGQQWGSEHAPEIDPFIADRFTVLKGAGALRYGADAIGGAILVEPKPLPRTPGLRGEWNSIYFANNRMGVVNASLEQNLERRPEWSWRTHLTYRRGGNARTPDYWLHNTGLGELNGSVNIGYRKDRRRAEVFASAFSTRLGIFWGSHIGNLTDLQTAINSPKPAFNLDAFTYALDRPRQEAEHYLLKAAYHEERPNGDRVNITLAHQENRRREFDRALVSERPELDLRLGTSMVDLNLEHKAAADRNATYGMALQRQENVWDGSRFFIPNFTTLMAGAYAMQRIRKEDAEWEAGIRYDYRNLRTIRNQNGTITQTARNFGNLSATLAHDKRWREHWRWTTNLVLAWRPPSVNELYVNGLHHGTANFEIGDPGLRSERSLKVAAQLRHEKDSSTELGITLHSNLISGFINLIPALPATLTLRGAYPTFRYVQTNAWLTGLDLNLAKDLSRAFRISAKSSLLLPRDLMRREWLQQMPPQRIEADLTWYFRSNHPHSSYITAGLLHVARQTLVPADNRDYLPPPEAYSLVNIEAATLLHVMDAHWNLGIGIANLLNTRYRDYMNRFRYFSDETGRNISIRLRIPF